MAKRYHRTVHFSRSKGRRVEAEFTGAEVTSNGGAMLLAEADRRMGLTRAAADAIGDDRRRKSVVHSALGILRQRIYGLILGHEDLNDHKRLRLDPALQAAAMRDGEMASPSTLCRFERRSSPAEAVALHEVLLEQFVAAHPVPPGRIVLDFDATDVECQYRLKIPQKCRSKIPQFWRSVQGRASAAFRLFPGGRPRRLGGGGGAMGALARTCSGTRSVCSRSR